MKYSACIEWLFAEAGDFPDRVRSASRFGFKAVEFWKWTIKDLDALQAALNETGMTVTACLAEPQVPLTDIARHQAFLEGVKRTLDVARRLQAKTLIVQAGSNLNNVARDRQSEALVTCLGAAADIVRGSGVILVLEPLNTLVDHPGYFLPSTVEGLDIIDRVNRAEVRLLYDIYHSAVMGENAETVVKGRVDRIAHVHLADAPGRHEPGSGALDWRRLQEWLVAQGYDGMIGLEYRPTGRTEDSLAFLPPMR